MAVCCFASVAMGRVRLEGVGDAGLRGEVFLSVCGMGLGRGKGVRWCCVGTTMEEPASDSESELDEPRSISMCLLTWP
jgi:hypothetical protein